MSELTKKNAKDMKPVHLDGRKDDLAAGLSRRSFYGAVGASSVGLLGTTFSILCCVTPLGVFLLGAFGMSFWLAKLDMFLLLILVCSLTLAGYGLWKLRT